MTKAHSPLASSASLTRQTREQFANPEDYLSYELGKAVQELPPLYTRLLAGTISVLVFGAIAWANFSKIDEVAVAQGELIPSAQVRPVRSLGEGGIVSVKVKEGDRVQKDQVLIERDQDKQQKEVDNLEEQAKKIREDIARLEAERTGAATAGTPLQDQLLRSRFKAFEDQYAAAVAETNRQVAVINEAKSRLNRLQENLINARTSQANAETNLVNSKSLLSQTRENLALAQKRLDSLKVLLSPGAVPRLDYLDAQERFTRAQAEMTRATDEITNAQNRGTEAKDKVISIEKDMLAQEQLIRQAEQAYESARNQAARIPSERQSEILTRLNERKEEMTAVLGRLEQAKKQREGETLKSPFAGTIYSVKATKGPVQPGEELLSILPEGEDLLLEVKVLNRDIGFISKGMRAKVKLATFPFQEFGTIDGEVVQISPNSIIDKELGLVFPTRIKLNKHTINVRGENVELAPGMAATGEIVTRKKSVLTFLIEPVTRRFGDAFSVR
jgi:HlyD family secretion protein